MTAHSQTLTLPPRRRGAPAEGELKIRGDHSTLDAIAELAKAMAAVPGAEELARAIAERFRRGGSDLEREVRLIDLLMPAPSTMSETATLQIRRNAAAREGALTEFGAFTSAELASARGSHAKNPHTTTSRWLRDGLAFAVDTPVGRLFPAFQFAQGAPRPVIAQVLAALGGQLRGWEILLWFTGSSGYLGGARPVDRLASAPEDVVAAAAYQASLSED
jgi:hypothetical protein